MNAIENKVGNRPQKVYFDLHLQKTQLQILSENKHKSGIYMIFNLVNTKAYIGSAISNRINVRFRNHCIHRTGSKLVYQAIQKYGLENFAFIILEYYPGFVKKENLTKRHLELLTLETNWIQKVQPEYNILPTGTSSLGYKHTIETRTKMKENYSESRREFCKNLNLNKTFSEEKKQFLSKIASLRNQNKELRERLAKAASKPVTLYNQDGTVHLNFSGIRAMARHFQCCHKTINTAIKNQSIFKGIGVIKYLHESKKDR
jgi:group I intron endonuclease